MKVAVLGLFFALLMTSGPGFGGNDNGAGAQSVAAIWKTSSIKLAACEGKISFEDLSGYLYVPQSALPLSVVGAPPWVTVTSTLLKIDASNVPAGIYDFVVDAGPSPRVAPVAVELTLEACPVR